MITVRALFGVLSHAKKMQDFAFMNVNMKKEKKKKACTQVLSLIHAIFLISVEARKKYKGGLHGDTRCMTLVSCNVCHRVNTTKHMLHDVTLEHAT